MIVSSLSYLLAIGNLFANHVRALDATTVETSNGVVEGFVNKSFPHVAQFLGIPYAEPPVGKRRWAPAVAKGRFGTLDASHQGAACPQSEPGNSGPLRPEFLIKPNSTSEDCLYLNVWTPYKSLGCNKEKLPVVVWIHGGGFTTGGGNIDYQVPPHWIERSQKHIVISLNYRLGVFGFPNAAGLDLREQNLGLLDQRLAVEWVRDNISRFGGDPKRITLWGQSVGGASVGYYQYAYPEDPIAHAYIQDSGGVFIPINNVDASHSNFTSIAKAFKCDKGNQVDCLRKIPFSDIQKKVEKTPAVSFVPMVDERTRFSDYTKRILSPNIPKMPSIIGTNRDEWNYLGSQPAEPPSRPPPDQVHTDNLFGCPAHYETALRSETNAKTWRYMYSSNFTNIMPGGEGAFHVAELPLIFGTHDIARTKSGPFEFKVSHAMQDYWLAFIQDPSAGLMLIGCRSVVGWLDRPWRSSPAPLTGSDAGSALPLKCRLRS
ncbi:chlorogenic acid esterase precursor [Fusarium beomiforme]|uniref:Chlorogenic acid esterase n=1 Tax=Fusarium beomiforme TaxID=44412 RepID=A0A9P5A8N2_9HYPO|nr:chlorogenic acid esterase precursor [Fusarium beomiforme]